MVHYRFKSDVTKDQTICNDLASIRETLNIGHKRKNTMQRVENSHNSVTLYQDN